MSYAVNILADSISPEGIRLTTMEATFPRFILAEMNTHTLFSRNSASSRAIPPENIIERVEQDPFVPETFGRRVKGMGVGEDLNAADAEQARNVWMSMRNDAVEAARYLIDLDCDKSRINRLLEPFMWHTAIISATEWANFYALRQPMEGPVPNRDFPAQPEMQVIARMMREAHAARRPYPVAHAEWGHLPLVLPDEAAAEGIDAPMISAGRCARVSFDTQHNFEPVDDSYARGVRLRDSGHWSPMQHPARPFSKAEWRAVRDAQHAYDAVASSEVTLAVRREAMRRMEMCGNYRGWVQLRKTMDNEFDHTAVLEAQQQDRADSPV